MRSLTFWWPRVWARPKRCRHGLSWTWCFALLSPKHLQLEDSRFLKCHKGRRGRQLVLISHCFNHAWSVFWDLSIPNTPSDNAGKAAADKFVPNRGSPAFLENFLVHQADDFRGRLWVELQEELLHQLWGLPDWELPLRLMLINPILCVANSCWLALEMVINVVVASIFKKQLVQLKQR